MIRGEEIINCRVHAHSPLSLLEYNYPKPASTQSPASPELHKAPWISASLNKSRLSMCVYHWAFLCETKTCRDTHTALPLSQQQGGNGTEVTLFHLLLLIKGSFTSLPLKSQVQPFLHVCFLSFLFSLLSVTLLFHQQQLHT